jgi:hypothetical protein
MSNEKVVLGVMQAAAFVISPMNSEEGVRGLLIEFLPHPQLTKGPPVRAVLPESIARDFHQKLAVALTFPRANPAMRSKTKN